MGGMEDEKSERVIDTMERSEAVPKILREVVRTAESEFVSHVAASPRSHVLASRLFPLLGRNLRVSQQVLE
jgi:hypothetical protein